MRTSRSRRGPLARGPARGRQAARGGRGDEGRDRLGESAGRLRSLGTITSGPWWWSTPSAICTIRRAARSSRGTAADGGWLDSNAVLRSGALLATAPSAAPPPDATGTNTTIAVSRPTRRSIARPRIGWRRTRTTPTRGRFGPATRRSMGTRSSHSRRGPERSNHSHSPHYRPRLRRCWHGRSCARCAGNRRGWGAGTGGSRQPT